MLDVLKTFCVSESGGAVEWIVTIIAGVLIAAVAYIKLKNSPGDVGNAVNAAGTRAANALNQVVVP